MKTFELALKNRKDTGKSATRKLRNEENVPCVMYGGDKIYHLYAHINSFLKLIYTPDVYLIFIDIEGDRHEAIIQDLQFDPVTDKITHIDFVEVTEDKPITIHLPVQLTGNSIGIKNGGKLRQKRRNLKVRALAKDLPEHLEIDITNVDISNVIKVGDLSYPGIELLDSDRSMVLSVVSSRVAMKGMTIDEPETAAVAEEETAEDEEGGESSEE